MINDDGYQNVFLIKTDYEFADPDCWFNIYGTGAVNNLASNEIYYIADFSKLWDYRTYDNFTEHIIRSQDSMQLNDDF